MFKKILAAAALSCAFGVSWAAVEINKASEAELDGIEGIGPATTQQILSERKKSEFKNWDDLMARVKGKSYNANAVKAFNATMVRYQQNYEIKDKREWFIVFNYMFIYNPLCFEDTSEYLSIGYHIGSVLKHYKAWKKAYNISITGNDWLKHLSNDSTDVESFMISLLQ